MIEVAAILLLVLVALVAVTAPGYLVNKRGKHARLRPTLDLLWAARNEWLAVPIAAMLFLASGIMLRAMDPTAGVFDTGVLQTLFVSAVQLFVAMTTAQVAVGISYKRLFRPKKDQPVCINKYVALYALYFSACVLLMAAL